MFCGLPYAIHFGTGPGGLVHHTAEDAMKLFSVYRYIESNGKKELSCQETSLKVKFLNCDFAIIFVTMNGHIFKLFINMFYDVQTEGKGEINTIKHYSNNGREWYFDTISVKELKSKVLLLIL